MSVLIHDYEFVGQEGKHRGSHVLTVKEVNSWNNYTIVATTLNGKPTERNERFLKDWRFLKKKKCELGMKH